MVLAVVHLRGLARLRGAASEARVAGLSGAGSCAGAERTGAVCARGGGGGGGGVLGVPRARLGDQHAAVRPHPRVHGANLRREQRRLRCAAARGARAGASHNTCFRLYYCALAVAARERRRAAERRRHPAKGARRGAARLRALATVLSSTSGLGIFFSVATTTPFFACARRAAAGRFVARRRSRAHVRHALSATRRRPCRTPRALIPNDVAPAATALSAYSICASLPLGEKVVSEKE